jgi:2-polyprenyl-3-methyl-5-hydroxy-6-metoxy-1,4-benzoquinol methylase
MWPTEQNRRAWEDRYGRRRPAGERLPDAIRERLPDVAGKHVLHLPCGGGDVAAELIALGALVTGVDPSEELLDAARATSARSAPRGNSASRYSRSCSPRPS